MKRCSAFFFGLLLGGLVEAIIDRLYWDRRLAALQAEKSSLKRQLEACQSQLGEFASQPDRLVAAPTPAKADVDKKTRQAARRAKRERDDLEIIRGIGPVINRKLNQAGIYTFKQLAAIGPDRLREIVGDVIQRLANEDSILAQARELAAKQDEG